MGSSLKFLSLRLHTGSSFDPTALSVSRIFEFIVGGKSNDGADGIAVDAAGNAYLTGFTSSSGFPTKDGAFQKTIEGGADAFVVKLTPGN